MKLDFVPLALNPGVMSRTTVLLVAIGFIPLVLMFAAVWARHALLRKKRRSRMAKGLLRALAAITFPWRPFESRWLRNRFRNRSKTSRRASKNRYNFATAGGDTADATVALARRSDLLYPGAVAVAASIQDYALSADEAWPFYEDDEISAVSEVLRSGKVNQWTGNGVLAFEEEYSALLDGRSAIALANGSLALELALRTFGIGPGDEVIVTPRTFVASVSCVRLVGATPVFAEVDRQSGNITPESIDVAITSRTRAVIPVHLGGWPADMPGIMAVAKARGIYVIEDCAQAHGALIQGQPVGSFGDAAAFSFCQDKIISTGGEGGLLAFRDAAAFEWAWSFKDHGKSRSKALQKSVQPGFRWLHDSVGTNWRMTEIAATIGRIQLEKLPEWHAVRMRNARIWASALRPVSGLRIPLPKPGFLHAFYRLYAYLDVDSFSNEALRNRILKAAADADLRVFSGSCSEVFREGAFHDLQVPTLDVAKELGDTSLAFEVHPTLDSRRLRVRAEKVADIIQSVLR